MHDFCAKNTQKNCNSSMNLGCKGRKGGEGFNMDKRYFLKCSPLSNAASSRKVLRYDCTDKIVSIYISIFHLCFVENTQLSWKYWIWFCFIRLWIHLFACQWLQWQTCPNLAHGFFILVLQQNYKMFIKCLF